jgi:predicted  nucleic acid-binding Zn-ribbon protein
MLVKQSKYDEVVRQRDQLTADLTAAQSTIEQQTHEIETLRATLQETNGAPSEAEDAQQEAANQNLETGHSNVVTQEETPTEPSNASGEGDQHQEAPVTPEDFQRLQHTLEESNQVIEAREAEIRNLSSQLEASNTRISELEETIHRLNEEAAVTTSRAYSPSDGSDDPSASLNEFCKENDQDTMACIERLKEEGF